VILVSPSEPPEIRAVGDTAATPEEFGADLLVVAEGQVAAVQRKRFPDDLLSSLSDGRLAAQVVRMQAADMRIVVLEGQPVWTSDGVLVGYDYGQGRQFTARALWGIMWSLHVAWDVLTCWTLSTAETRRFVEALDQWLAKPVHELGWSRAKRSEPSRGRRQTRARQLHFLQGLPGVGPGLAAAILDEFGHVPMRWTVPPVRMLEVEGIGRKRLSKLGEFVAWPDKGEEST